jgi:shikimate dehydrogenase
VREIDGKTELFGLIGSGIAYTLSPAIHNYIFEKLDYNAIYYPFDVPKEKFEKVVEGLLEVCKGLNVTIPYKEAIIPYLSSLDKTAEKVGAVNTVYGRRGFNTDYIAVKKLVSRYRELVESASCYVFGAGGAAKAVAIALGELGCEKIVIVNRTREKAARVVQRLKNMGFNAEIGNILCMERRVVVANATPNPDFVPDICVEKAQLVIELVYRPLETSLVKRALRAGARVINGIEILVEQAVEAQKIWLGIDFPVEEVLRYLYARKLIW